MSSLKIGTCIQCEEADEILEGQAICSHCDSLQRKWDLENGVIEITKDNIHLYYEFMSNKTRCEYGEILYPILIERRAYVDSILDILLKDFGFSYNKKGEWVSCSFFGIQDILKPIDDYINEIKNSEQYKNYLANK